MRFLILAVVVVGGESLGTLFKHGAVNNAIETPGFGWKDLRILEGLGNVTRSLIGSDKSNAKEVDAVVDLTQQSITISGYTYYPDDKTGKEYTKLTGDWQNYTFKIKINSSQIIKSINITIAEKNGTKIDNVYIDLGETEQRIVDIDSEIAIYKRQIGKIPNGQDQQTKQRLETTLKDLENSKQTITNIT
jgi:hypothetical protein